PPTVGCFVKNAKTAGVIFVPENQASVSKISVQTCWKIVNTHKNHTQTTQTTETETKETETTQTEAETTETDPSDETPDETVPGNNGSETAEAQKMLEMLEKSLLTAEGSQVYTGQALKPALKLVYTDESGKEQDITEQFILEAPEYTNNVNAGKAKVSVKATGYYKIEQSGQKTPVMFRTPAEKEGSFVIAAASIKSASVELSSTSYTYTGNPKKPGVTVTLGGKTLKKDTDYTVTYKNNVNAGKASVTVAGKGNYTGSPAAKTYTIKHRDISKASVSLSTTTYTYNGKDKKPGVKSVKVKMSSSVTKTLKKDRDYTVTYSKNTKSVGSKTVYVKGTGNYSGTAKKTYKIIPEKATGVKVSGRTTTSFKVSCNKAKTSGCEYRFLLKTYDSKKDKWVDLKSKTLSSNSYTFSKLTPGMAYRVYARVYKVLDGKYYKGNWSESVKTVTLPSKTVVSYATKTGSKTMKVTWKAVSNASGYQIQYSTYSDFSRNQKIIKVSGRSTTSKKISLKSTSTYYVRVRAYRTCEDHTYYAAWSSKVSTSYSNLYSSYSTSYNSGNTNRSTNLRLACKAINGTVLSNGSTFSFNGIVGERTAAKGYKEAIIYEGGQEVGGIGGGICQVATTIFNAVLKANFTVVERHQHSLTVHYCPLGYDAAIAWGSKNLRFRNNSGTSVKVLASASGGTLSVKFMTNIYKKPPKVTTKVTVRNGVYTLKRYVNGKCNYTTTSDYLDN
ncbi:MAG: VanW family protein, partial [Lachnospiraceae bacterium]|nr:VanW family protein [Lachnospiraceae bacterium]